MTFIEISDLDINLKLKLSQYIREAYEHKKRTSPDRLKIRRNCIKTLDFSISIYIIMLHSYINAFICN